MDAARALLRARRVLIVTGFCLSGGIPETDGPPGAAALGRALRRLGARVRYVTDPAVVPPLVATLTALGEPADVDTYPGGDDAAPTVLRRERPTHLVAIERPGRTGSGDYLSARAESIAAWNGPLDELFLCNGSRAAGARRGGRGSRPAPSRGTRATTVAVGDGGNEIGMGNARRQIQRVGGLLARTASVVTADHLVVAGTSNWGAYGIVAALGRLGGESLLHTGAQERRMIEACVEAGAIDGITRRPEPTVDSLPLEIHAGVVEVLRAAERSGMIERARRTRR
jgi:hypothetical protein